MRHVRKAKSQAGFTIVEVMTVTMIIGVLASLVLPTVRVNAVRAKMSEAMLALAACRDTITEVYISGGDSPGAGQWGCEIEKEASKYVDSITTDAAGKIRASLRGFGDLRIDTQDLTLMPLDNTGTPMDGSGGIIRRWRCGSPVDLTTVPPQYLPSTCRG